MKSLVSKRLRGGQGEETAESSPPEKIRQAPQKEGRDTLCDPGWYIHKPDVQNKWDDRTHTQHTHTHIIIDRAANHAHGLLKRKSRSGLSPTLCSYGGNKVKTKHRARTRTKKTDLRWPEVHDVTHAWTYVWSSLHAEELLRPRSVSRPCRV